jgi:3-oxoacyl-[acyl-carrier-protein] synthase-3
MATVAGSRAIAAAGLEPTDIDLILMATCTPDRLIPAAAAMVQRRLGAEGAACMDINAACTGFVYGLATASSMISAGLIDRALVIGADKLSAFLNFAVRDTAVLFGDGAGAVVLEATDRDEGVLATTLGTDGSLTESLTVTGTGSESVPPPVDGKTIHMEGREVFRHAVVRMGETAAEAIEKAGLTVDDVDILVPHQANIRIIDNTARRLDLPQEKVFTNIASYGNTSAASIPIALTEALEEGRVRPGANVVFVAFGGGLTWGAAVVRWGERVVPLAESAAALPPTDKTGLELLAARPGRGA